MSDNNKIECAQAQGIPEAEIPPEYPRLELADIRLQIGSIFKIEPILRATML